MVRLLLLFLGKSAWFTYVDEEAGVLQRGLLTDLLHDFGLCVEGHFDGGLGLFG